MFLLLYYLPIIWELNVINPVYSFLSLKQQGENNAAQEKVHNVSKVWT